MVYKNNQTRLELYSSWLGAARVGIGKQLDDESVGLGKHTVDLGLRCLILDCKYLPRRYLNATV